LCDFWVCGNAGEPEALERVDTDRVVSPPVFTSRRRPSDSWRVVGGVG